MCGGNSRANSAQSRPAALSWRRSGSGERLATCGAALSWWGGSCWHRWRPLVLWPLHCAQGSPNSKLPRPDSVVPCLKSPKLDDHFGISHINLMLSQQLSYIKKGPQVKKYKWAEKINKRTAKQYLQNPFFVPSSAQLKHILNIYICVYVYICVRAYYFARQF